ncbi:MAG: hypothetical protein Pars2KO_10700 [Parasphingorhabdus sp.]
MSDSRCRLLVDPATTEPIYASFAKEDLNKYCFGKDVGRFPFKCTDMLPHIQAVRDATGLPVFDAVDMAKDIKAKVDAEYDIRGEK